MPGKKEGREMGRKNKRRKGYRGRVGKRESGTERLKVGAQQLSGSWVTPRLGRNQMTTVPSLLVKQLQSSGSALVLPLSLPRLSRDEAASGENKGSLADAAGRRKLFSGRRQD